MLEGARLLLWDILTQFGVTTELALLNQAERTNKLQGHLVHLKFGIDSGELAIEDKIHEQGLDDIILVMAEGNLVAAKFLCSVEERLAAVPGAEEARVFVAFLLADGCILNDERDAELIAERAEVRQVAQIRAFLNTYVHSRDAEARDENLCTFAKKLDHRQRILAATEGDEDMVAFLDKRVVGAGFVEPLG